MSKVKIRPHHYICGTQLFNQNFPDKILRLHPDDFRNERTLHQTFHSPVFQKNPALFIRKNRPFDPGSQSDKRRNIKGKYYCFISFFADFQNPVDQFTVPLMDAVKFSKCYHTSLIQLKIQIFCNIFHVSFHSSLCRNCFSNCFYGTKHLTEYCLQNRYASFSFR